MDDIQKKYLSGLYKEYSIDHIDSNCRDSIVKAMGVNTYEELKNNAGFNNYNLILKSCRLRLDQFLALPTEDLQICAVLELLWASRKSCDEVAFATNSDFFLDTIYHKWSGPKKANFDFAVHEIISRRHVFISYTNRNARLNNSLYKPLIEACLTTEQINQDNMDKKNLVVWAIKQQLIDNDQLIGYFDQNRNDFENGINLPGTLENYCNTSTTFLQFVEKKTFDTQGKFNYCFEEFRFYSNGYCKIKDVMTDVKYADGYFFIKNVIDQEMPMIYPANLSENYFPWRDVIETKTVYLQLHSKTTFGQFLNELSRLATDIRERADNIFDNYKKACFTPAAL